QAGRAVLAAPGDLLDPAGQLAADLVDVSAGSTLEEIVLHVLHARLDLPLLLRRARRRRVDLEAVVPRQLAVAAVERALSGDAQGGADHGGLQGIGHHRPDPAAQR